MSFFISLLYTVKNWLQVQKKDILKGYFSSFIYNVYFLLLRVKVSEEGLRELNSKSIKVKVKFFYYMFAFYVTTSAKSFLKIVRMYDLRIDRYLSSD